MRTTDWAMEDSATPRNADACIVDEEVNLACPRNDIRAKRGRGSVAPQNFHAPGTVVLNFPAGSENDKAGSGKAFGGGVVNLRDAPLTITVPHFSAGGYCLAGLN